MCWGRNKEGQATPPSKSTSLGGTDNYYSKVSAGHRHTCAVRDAARSSDTVICWGSNYAGESRAMFRGLFKDVTCGAQHSCGVTSMGDVRCWGSNTYGQSLSKTTKNIRGSG
jgi:large repetitive protein